MWSCEATATAKPCSTALLPVFATTILHVGPLGFGLLRSASAAGSLTAALVVGRLLPQRRAGQVLPAMVAGFGLSRSLLLSLTALFVAGLCDGTSVVIRRAILRLASPEAMRRRGEVGVCRLLQRAWGA